MKDSFVYILSNSAANLYIGVTSNLDQRLFDHANRTNPRSFTSRYDLNRLVLVETYPDPSQAMAREKQLKGWTRVKKPRLIESHNPMWRDLSAEYPSLPCGSPEADPSTSSG